MRLRKNIIGTLLCVLILLVVAFCVVSIVLSDSHINGFVGTVGVMRLDMSNNSYIELANNPTRFIVRTNDFDNALREIFNEDYDSWHWSGWGTRNGTRYYYSTSSFTRRYSIVSLNHKVSVLDLTNEFDDYIVITAKVLDDNFREVVIRDDTERTTLSFRYYNVNVIDVEHGHLNGLDNLIFYSYNEVRDYDARGRLLSVTLVENDNLAVNEIVRLKLFRDSLFNFDFSLYQEFGENIFLYLLYRERTF
jgi:hypothetical protein